MSIGSLLQWALTELRANVDIIASVGNRVYDSTVGPNDPAYPYIVVSHETENDSRGGIRFPLGTLEVTVATEGTQTNTALATIMNQVLNVLDNKYITGSFGYVSYTGERPVILPKAKATSRAKAMSFSTNETY